MIALFKLLFLFGCLFLVPRSSHSQITECNGVWTNQGCESRSATVIEEKPHQPISAEQREKSQRNLWIQNLTNKLHDARRAYDIEMEIGPVASVCQDLSAPIASCREEVAVFETRLDERIDRAREIQNSNAAPIVEPSRSDNSQVVIIDNSSGYYPHPRPYGVYGGYYPNYRRQSSGVSIEVTGRSSDGTIQGGFSAHSTDNEYPEIYRPIPAPPLGVQPTSTPPPLPSATPPRRKSGGFIPRAPK